MRQAVAGLLAFVYAAAFAQTPWAHVHRAQADPDHHQQQHAGLGLIHGHSHVPAAQGPEWGGHDADDEDARFLGPVRCVPGARVAFAVVPTGGDRTAAPVVARVGEFIDPAPRAHGPPGLRALPPRAPPA